MYMKRIHLLFSVPLIFTLFTFTGCRQNNLPRLEEISENTPEWINDPRPQDTLWGTGVGDLSALNASCEQAKFNAQLDICRQLSVVGKMVENTADNLSELTIITRLNLYQNEFYNLLSLAASQQASFALSELIKVDRRTRTADGKIWYRVSFPIKEVENIQDSISQYQGQYFNAYLETVEPMSEVDTESMLKPMSEADAERMLKALEEAFRE
jgi:hypothetical protein